MDTENKGMARKRERHFNETKQIVAMAIIICGIVITFVLLVMWPQKFIVDVFNSRLMYHLIVDIEDYWTCDVDNINFVIDEPSSSFALYSIYVFNVSNAKNVFQRGEKPLVVESGPFGFVKNTYKYDIAFSDDSLEVAFKEYSLLSAIDTTDQIACYNMYYQLERDYLDSSSCSGSKCMCQSPLSLVTVVNPIFLKIAWDDTVHDMLAHYSVDVFKTVKSLLDEPFTEAVKAHLVSKSLLEAYLFRVQSQSGLMMNTAFDSLRANFTLQQIARTRDTVSFTNCGLKIYSAIINSCPFQPYASLDGIMFGTVNDDILSTDYPYIDSYLDRSNPNSFLNLESGLPKYVGLAYFQSVVDFNSRLGYTMMTAADFQALYRDLYVNLAVEYFSTQTPTANQLTGSSRIISALVRFIGVSFIKPYSIDSLLFQAMTYSEFADTYAPVLCVPSGRKCLYQWGYMRHTYNLPFVVTPAIAVSLINVGSASTANPNNLYFDGNAPKWYNTYLYATRVHRKEDTFNISCTSYAHTVFDGTVTKPAGLWAIVKGVPAADRALLHIRYQKETTSAKKQMYFNFAANLSVLAYEVFREGTPYHDEFVVDFLNRNKDPRFNHTFTIGNWTELGLAQWGGGFVTYALLKVRAINEVIRDGMWRFGADNYYSNYIEYCSWTIRQGYPQAYIYSVEQSRALLYLLAQQDDEGFQFRRHVFYRGSTYIGDGVNFQNGVGAIGEVTFTPEANLGDFSCSSASSSSSYVCSLLTESYSSSPSRCLEIEAMFKVCFNQDNVLWIEHDNCVNFATSLSEPTFGIQCDDNNIYGKSHPYTKSRGNMVYQMMYSLTLQLQLVEGLWCDNAATCDFKWGGLFTTTTTVNKLLFEGYTEPSILKYYNLKYLKYGLSFECIGQPYDMCGVQNFKCSDLGIVMLLPSGDRFPLVYGQTPNDEYFAPSFILDLTTSELLWPHSANETTVEYALELLKTHELNRTLSIHNPIWTAYPAWNSQDVRFNKFYQCQKRTLFGTPNLFNDCLDVLYTGRDKLNKTLDMRALHGNETLSFFSGNDSRGSLAVNGSTMNNQYNSFLYPGFSEYPYSYLGLNKGVDFGKQTQLTVFHKQNSLQLVLSQASLLFGFQKDIALTIPFPRGPQSGVTDGPSLGWSSRRFVEDTTTWDNLRGLGVARDSYGMQYTTPKGMASLQHYTAFPVFADTPHSYGNRKWGGMEFDFISGTTQNEFAQRTYIDYDPVTGRALRQAIRQQVNLRVEASALFPRLFSSLTRCTAPSNSYNLGSGHGCFAFIPLLWYEDARVVETETFFQLHDHFYSRPTRASTIGLVGVAVGLFLILIGSCLLVSELHHKRRFHQRVYID